MIKTEHILEFDKIKETWKTFALTESARTEIEKNRANDVRKRGCCPAERNL